MRKRSRRSAVLVTALGMGLVSTLAACGGSSHPAASSGTTVPGSYAQDVLARVTACLKNNGVSVPSDATAPQLGSIFLALPKAQQEKVITVCGPLLPERIRTQIEQEVNGQTTTTTTTF